MKYNFIFAIILLITLSMVNAAPHNLLRKRATTFAPCPSGSPFPLTVTIQPDPPVAGGTEMFTISGTPASDIPAGTRLALQLLDSNENPIGDPQALDFCTSGITCPVAAGSAFSAIAQFTIPATLPKTYNMLIVLADPSAKVLACSIGTVTGS